MTAYALTPWPNWCQNADATVDGRPDENAANDCGPESVAECVWYISGVSLEADYLKDWAYGEAYTGYTDVVSLVRMLEEKAGIPTRVLAGDATTKLRPAVEAALSSGCPIIVLYFWDTVNLKGGHFCPVVACDDDTVTRSNVWNGQLERWTWDEFERVQQGGNAIICCRQRALQTVMVNPSAPTPLHPPAGSGPAAKPIVGYVVHRGHNLRALPQLVAPFVAHLAVGESLTPLRERTTHWAKVRTAAGKVGWCFLPHVHPTYK